MLENKLKYGQSIQKIISISRNGKGIRVFFRVAFLSVLVIVFGCDRIGVNEAGEKKRLSTNSVQLKTESSSYDLPIMLVHSEGTNTTGLFRREKFKFATAGGKEPFRISISENMPLGSSDVIRSSVWKAAFVASLQRNVALNGCSIELGLSGRVDGPSAGGVLCLAIMSAIDGRQFPEDFCMTGTIFPDGTIGLVGGVAAKIRAAADSGIKRICIPAGLRFERQNNGDSVDLYTLCAEKDVKIFPVGSIEEAYSFAHGLNPEKDVPFDEAVIRLPSDTEKLLIHRFNVAKERNKELMESVKKIEIPSFILQDKHLVKVVNLENDQVFNSGRILSATVDEERKSMVLEGLPIYQQWTSEIKERYPALKNPPPYLLKRSRTAFVSALKKVGAEVLNIGRNGSYDNTSPVLGPTPISAQWETLVTNGAYIKLLRDRLKNLLEITDRVNDNGLSIIWNFVQASAFELICQKDFSTREIEDRLAFFKSFQFNEKHLDKVDEMEMTFYQGVSAIHRSLVAEGKTYVSARNVQKDFEKGDFISTLHVVEKIHQVIEGRISEDNKYQRLALLLYEADLIALEYACSFIEWEKYYQMPLDFWRRIVRRARTAAVENIDKCVTGGIPCPVAIYNLEKGDSLSFSGGLQVKDVLRFYWSAALQAKVLYLVYGGIGF